MDTSAKKILETVTVKTLHAHGFSRSSTQANLVLADLLSRYLSNLSATAAKYAEHAGRRSIVAADAMEAFKELGTNMDELKDYCATESRDMARYAVHSSKRVEDLAEFKAQLALGLSHDDDDLIPLEWGPVPDDLPSDDEEESEEEEIETPSDDLVKAEIMMVDSPDAEGEEVPLDEDPALPLKDLSSRRPPTPPLPLSPVSNPSTPPRKRPRMASWQPPEHVPEFLPPFPADDPIPQVASPHPTGLGDPSSLGGNAVKQERPTTPPLQAQVSTASSSADYLTVVPYDQSSLATVPAWHLPTRPPMEDTSNTQSDSQAQILQTQPALLAAYHHLLTNPPPARVAAANPARYRVALALVQHTEKNSRWDAPATLFGGPAPNLPRVAAMPPSYAIPIVKGAGGGSSGAATPPDGSAGGSTGGKGGEAGEEKRPPLPPAPPRTISVSERVVPSIVRQDSRIPQLARHVLSGNVYARTVRVTHPPVLQRGAQKLTYGPGVNAPWNASFSPAPATTPATAAGGGGGKGKDGNGNGGGGGMANGKEKEKDGAGARPLPDARFYATWNYEPKRFDDGLVAARRRMGSIAGPGAAAAMGRARSESMHP